MSSTSAIGSTQAAVVDADDLALDARGIGKRPEQVEDRSDAELGAHGRPGLDRRVMERAPTGSRRLPRGWRAPIVSGGTSSLTPSAASTSEAPDSDDTERLPCLATWSPAPAATKAAQVETLKVAWPSPPVPTMSIASAGAVTAAHLGAHEARGAGDLGHRLAAHAQRHQEGAHLRGRRVAGGHRVEGLADLAFVEALGRRRPSG